MRFGGGLQQIRAGTMEKQYACELYFSRRARAVDAEVGREVDTIESPFDSRRVR
ncbi:hypothetical protein BSFA1_85670 (plasmid) [Burkholderia sp. SFA1]|nr:hypothetical protein BSFA1_85670 [Burkholderia sp. SFA1]